MDHFQKLLRQSFEALFEKERLSYMGAFTQGLIHNINGPLQNMSMLIELILSGQDRANQLMAGHRDGFDDKWSQFHEKQRLRILQLSNQISFIVEMLRDFMSLNEIERNDSEVDLNLVIHKLIQSFRADLFFKHHVTLELRLTENLPLIRVLARHLIPSLVNLFKNAMLALREAPERRLAIETCRQADVIGLVFSDNGCGFTEEQGPKLFQPFYSGWPPAILTHDKHEKHFGLGLFIARSLLEPYGITVELERRGAETHASLSIPIVSS